MATTAASPTAPAPAPEPATAPTPSTGADTATSPPPTTTAPPAATKDASSTGPASSEKPSEAALAEVFKLDVLDRDSKKVSFGSLVQGDGASPRTVVVFIRHFFCGDYVRTLMEQLPPSKLAALSPSTRLVIIGHGDPGLISKYSKETGCEFPIYADPTRKTYEKLGFVSNLQQSKNRPGYMRRTMFSQVLDSLRQNFAAGSKMLGGGKISQNGGELIFEGGKLGYFYRMRNTTDHTEPEDLAKVLAA